MDGRGLSNKAHRERLPKECYISALQYMAKLGTRVITYQTHCGMVVAVAMVMVVVLK